MDTPKIFESEYRFCLILWEREPVTTTELVRLCQERLGWKRTTTYTVIKRLGERGVVRNDNGVVRRSSRALSPPFWRPSPGGRTCRRRRWRRFGGSSRSKGGAPWRPCF